MNYQLSQDQEKWIKRMNRRYGHERAFWAGMIMRERGKCALTQVDLRFDIRAGTARCHPLYASVDHIVPDHDELQIVCYDINDLKGHIPWPLFQALVGTKAWHIWKNRWKRKATDVSRMKRLSNREAAEKLMSLIRPGR